MKYLSACEDCNVNRAGDQSSDLCGRCHRLMRMGSLAGTMGAGWYSPLCMAAEYHHTDIAALLIDAGADINAGEEWFPLYLAGERCRLIKLMATAVSLVCCPNCHQLISVLGIRYCSGVQ